MLGFNFIHVSKMNQNWKLCALPAPTRKTDQLRCTCCTCHSSPKRARVDTESICYKIWLFAIPGHNRDITGATLFCVNIGNGWNNVYENCLYYSYLYWVKLSVIWISSDFQFLKYQVTYKVLTFLYYTLFRRWDLLRGSCLQVLPTGWVAPTVLRERGAWKVDSCW